MKKLVVTSLLTLALVFGFGEAAFAASKPKPKVSHSTINGKPLRHYGPKYSTKGSGFRHTPKINHYHKYWTGGTKNRQHGK